MAETTRTHSLSRLDARELDAREQPREPGTLRHPDRPASGRLERDLGPGAAVGILGRSSIARDLFRRLERASRGREPVFLEGETGAGKLLAARALHALGGRPGAPFAIADREDPGTWREGMAAMAASGGGTFLIHEVAGLSAGAQVELSSLLAAPRRRGTPGPAGAESAPRLVCTSSRDLRAEVERGRLREDLCGQLRGVALPVPSLRERREDLPLLIEHFLTDCVRRHGKRVAGVQPGAMELLLAHGWEGNVRELRGEIERAVLLTGEGQPVAVGALSPDLGGSGARLVDRYPSSLRQRSRELEKRMLAGVLARNDWNVAATARELGISRVGLSKKLRTMEMERPRRRPRG